MAALTSASLLGSAALSQAAVIVSHDFSYADGNLEGQNGVAKIRLGAGATSTVRRWVGRPAPPVDVSGAAMATVTTADFEGVNRIRIMSEDFDVSVKENGTASKAFIFISSCSLLTRHFFHPLPLKG